MPKTSHFRSLATLLIIISGIGATGLVGSSEEAYACEAFSSGSPSPDRLDNSAAVFSGKVVEFRKVIVEKPAGEVRIAFFQVDRYWKSNLVENEDYKQLVVVTAIDHGACGYDFEEGKSFLVYADKWTYEPDLMYTGLGYGTQPIENAQEHLAFLGEGKVPTIEGSWDDQMNGIDIQPLPTGQEEQQESIIISVIGIGAATAGAVAFFSLRRLKDKEG